MSNYIVDGADLTSVANAIRTKGGTSAALAFPADFVSAIAAIPSGGGGAQIATGTFTGSGARSQDVICPFEPDLVYCWTDTGGANFTGTVGLIVAREMFGANKYANNSTANSSAANGPQVAGMNTNGSGYNFMCSYTNGTVTIYSFSNAARNYFNENYQYSYRFIKWTP